MKKVSKKLIIGLYITIGILIVALAYQKDIYIGDKSCRIKIVKKFLGIEISSKESACAESDYLESLAGKVDNDNYFHSGKKSFLVSWKVGTPEGNWFSVYTLKGMEESGKLSHQTALSIANKLISDNSIIREGAIESVKYYESFKEGESEFNSVVQFPHDFPQVKPDTVEKALDILNAYMSTEQKDSLAKAGTNDLDTFNYFSIGLWIRYNFGLWGDNPPLMTELKCKDPQKASMILIKKMKDSLTNAKPLLDQ